MYPFSYYLYHWPLSMAMIVVSGIFFSVALVTILVWIRRGIERINRFTYYRRFAGQRMQLRAPRVSHKLQYVLDIFLSLY